MERGKDAGVFAGVCGRRARNLVDLADVDGKAGGQGLDGDLAVHLFYILSFEPRDCIDNSKIKFYEYPAL